MNEDSDQNNKKNKDKRKEIELFLDVINREEISRTSGPRGCVNCQNITCNWIRCQECVKQDGISNFYCNDQCIRKHHDFVNEQKKEYNFDH